MKPKQTLYILVALIHVVFMIQIENFDVWNKGMKTPQKNFKSMKTHANLKYSINT